AGHERAHVERVAPGPSRVAHRGARAVRRRLPRGTPARAAPTIETPTPKIQSGETPTVEKRCRTRRVGFARTRNPSRKRQRTTPNPPFVRRLVRRLAPLPESSWEPTWAS